MLTSCGLTTKPIVYAYAVYMEPPLAFTLTTIKVIIVDAIKVRWGKKCGDLSSHA